MEKILKKNNTKFTKEQIKKIMETDVKKGKENVFLHCRKCIKDFDKGLFGRGKSPAEALDYYAASVPFEYPNRVRANIIAVFCKRCGESVWSTKHLTHLF